MGNISKDWVPVGGSGRVMTKDTPLHKVLRETQKENPEFMKDLANGGLARVWDEFCKESVGLYGKD